MKWATKQQVAAAEAALDHLVAHCAAVEDDEFACRNDRAATTQEPLNWPQLYAPGLGIYYRCPGHREACEREARGERCAFRRARRSRR